MNDSISASGDVIVVGGGIIGAASALALARAGCDVLLLERETRPSGATVAAAGILGAQLHSRDERDDKDLLLQLCCASRSRYGDWVGALAAASDADIGYQPCGSLRVAFSPTECDALRCEVSEHRAAGLRAELLDAQQSRELEPELAGGIALGALFPDDAVLDPPSLLVAAWGALKRHSHARILCQAPVAAIEETAGRVVGVQLEDGRRLAADHVVVAAGAWSGLLQDSGLHDSGLEAPHVVPARGQIVELRLEHQLLRHAIDGPDGYLSPRCDGRVLVGSTVEYVGFEDGVTAEAVSGLMVAALDMVPALPSAEVTALRSGLRPATADGLPILCRGPLEGLVLATGHFRNGVLLAPLTADIVRDIVCARPPVLDLAPYDYRRFGAVDSVRSSAAARQGRKVG